MEEILVPFFLFCESEMIVENSQICLFIFRFRRFGHLQIQNDKGF